MQLLLLSGRAASPIPYVENRNGFGLLYISEIVLIAWQATVRQKRIKRIAPLRCQQDMGMSEGYEMVGGILVMSLVIDGVP